MKEEELSTAALENGRLLVAGPCDFILGVAALHQLPDADVPEIATKR